MRPLNRGPRELKEATWGRHPPPLPRLPRRRLRALQRPLALLAVTTALGGSVQKEAGHVEEGYLARGPKVMLANFKQVFNHLKEEGATPELLVGAFLAQTKEPLKVVARAFRC